MAFFERTDERDPLITCNICNVKCAERSMTQHKSKCADKHSDKFTSGKLERCSYDSGHFVEPDKMKLHLEFCIKRQSYLVAEYQRETAKIHRPDEKAKENGPAQVEEPEPFATSDDWGVQANSKPYIAKMRFK